MGFGRITKREKARAVQPQEWTMQEGPRNSHYLSKAKAGREPLVFLANNRTLIQQLVPAGSTSRLPQFSEIPALSDDLLASDQLGQYTFEEDSDFDTTPLSPRKAGDSPTKKKRHRANLQKQGEAWQEEVIPESIPVFLKLWHKTRGLRDADALTAPKRSSCETCDKWVVCKVSVLRFTSKPLDEHALVVANVLCQVLKMSVLQCVRAPPPPNNYWRRVYSHRHPGGRLSQ